MTTRSELIVESYTASCFCISAFDPLRLCTRARLCVSRVSVSPSRVASSRTRSRTVARICAGLLPSSSFASFATGLPAFSALTAARSAVRSPTNCVVDITSWISESFCADTACNSATFCSSNGLDLSHAASASTAVRPMRILFMSVTSLLSSATAARRRCCGYSPASASSGAAVTIGPPPGSGRCSGVADTNFATTGAVPATPSCVNRKSNFSS